MSQRNAEKRAFQVHQETSEDFMKRALENAAFLMLMLDNKLLTLSGGAISRCSAET